MTRTQTGITQFTEVELQSMCLAGEVTRHGIAGFEFYLPVGSLPSRIDRAESLLCLMRPGRAITGSAARWVHAGGPPPDRVELSRRSGRMLQIDQPVACKFRRLKPTDVETICGLTLSTVERTARDLRKEGRLSEAALLAPLLEPIARAA